MKDNSVLFLLMFFIVIIYVFYQIRYVDNQQPNTIYINRPQPIYIPYNRHKPRRNRIHPMPPARPIRPIIPVKPLPRPDIKK